MSERKRYVIGVTKIPQGDRDVAHRFITPEDDRGFFDIIGADSADESDEFPIGARCSYRLELTDEEAEVFRQASNCRYVEEDRVCSKPVITGKTETAYPSADVLRFIEADFPRSELWHGRDVLVAIIDGWTSAGSRLAIEANMVARVNFGEVPTTGETHDSHADMCMSAMIPYSGQFLDVNATNNDGHIPQSNYCAGARWAVDNGAKVIMISAALAQTNGTPVSPSQLELDMGDYVQDRGVPCFIATGNDGQTAIATPSRLSVTYSLFHSVGAWEQTDTGVGNIASFSNRSAEMSGVTPGFTTLALDNDGKTQQGHGTSIASPFAALVVIRAMTGSRFSGSQASVAAKANMRSLGSPAATQGGGAYSLLRTLQGLGAMTETVHNPGGPYTNLSTNPTCATVTTNWVAGASGVRATGLSQAAFERDTGFSGSSNLLTPKAAGSSGNSYSHSVALRCSSSATVNVSVRWYNSTGTLLSTTNARDITWQAGGVSRVAVSGTAPANTASSAMYITTTAGTLTAATHMAEVGTTNHPFFDGFSIGGAWTGSPGLSTATKSFAVPVQELRYNLSSNPSFEVDLTGCSISNVRSGVTVTALSRLNSVLAYPTGTFYAFVNTSNAGVTSTDSDWLFNLPDASVNPGYTYMFSGHIKHQALGAKVRWIVDWYDSGNTLLSSSVSSGTTDLQTDFQRVWTTLVAPFNAAIARPKIEYFGGPNESSARSVRFDGFHIERASNLTRYFDGSETGGTWIGTANKSASYLGSDDTYTPPPTVTEVVGTFLNGSTAATSFNLTAPAGVTAGMTGLFIIASGSSDATVFTLTKAGATFTKVEEINAQNMRVAVFTGTGITPGTITIGSSISVAVTVGHYYQDGWTYSGLVSTVRSVSQATTTTGSVTATSGQKLFIVGAERTTAVNAAPGVTASGGETVTQKTYGEGTGSAQSSVYIGTFDASNSGSRTATLTYTNSSANGYAAAILTSTSGGGGGGGGGSVVVLKPGVLHNIGRAGGKNHFNLGVGKTSGHVNIPEIDLENGYELPEGSAGGAFYYTKADGTAVVMGVPLNGAKTSTNTKYPRVEYRELTAGGSGNSSQPEMTWDGNSDEHYIIGRTRVVKLPPVQPWVVVAQIHDGQDDVAKIVWRSKTSVNGSWGDTDFGTIATGLSVGTEYQWKLRVLNGNIEYYWVDMSTPKLIKPDGVDVNGDAAGCYFKAGNYAQSNSTIDSVSDGPVIIELRDFICWHTGYPPPSSSVTGAPVVNAGDDASVQINQPFNRIATENANGSTISSRSWKIQSGPTGVGSTVDTDASLGWTPTLEGTYVLRFSATNSIGTGTDDVTVTATSEVITPPPGGGASPYTQVFGDGIAWPVIGKGTTTVSVASASALTSALSSATGGQKITLANGTYSGDFTINAKSGTQSSGISIISSTNGGAILGSGSTFTIKDCAHVHVEGLSLPYDGPGEMINIRGTSHHIRITRCTLGPSGAAVSSSTSAQFVYVSDSAEHIRIDHNMFRNKGTAGNYIKTYGLESTLQVNKHVLIDHNIIMGCKPEIGNGKEPIRLGFSGYSKSMSYSDVFRNYFTDNLCEPEVVSVKAGGIRVVGNTFYRNAGGPVIRHGTDCMVADNYVVDGNNTIASAGLKSGGCRFYDKNHTVSYNYFEGLIGENFQASLLLDTGDAEGSSTSLANHWRVINAKVERNVIISCQTPIQVGDNYSSFPQNCTVIDNITAGTVVAGPIVYLGGTSAATTGTVTGNTHYASPAAGGFAQDAGTTWRKTGYGPRITRLGQADVGITGDPNDTDGAGVGISGGTGGGTPTVSAGSDATVLLNNPFSRTAGETGSGITARQWQITGGPAQVGTVLATASTVSWTPTVLGVYTLVYSATNSFGTGSDSMTVTVSAGGGGGGTGSPVEFVGVGVGGTGASTSIAVPAPAGVETGMFQVCVIQTAAQETMSTVPPSWILMATLDNISGTGDPGGPASAWVYYNTTGSIDATWIKSGTRFWHAVRAVWKNQTQLGQVASQVGTSSASHATPSVTPTKPNSVVVGIITADLVNGDPGPFTPPTGWTKRYDSSKLQATEREAITIADVSTGATPVTGTFIGTLPDESARFAFVLEGPLLEQIMIPVSIP